MPLVLIVALLSVCVAFVLAGYAWNAYKAKHKKVQRKPTVLRQVVGQPNGEPEPSSQNEVLELASVGSKSTGGASEAHGIHIATSFPSIEASVETALAPCAPESLPRIAETTTNLVEIDGLNGPDLIVGEAAKMEHQPVVDTSLARLSTAALYRIARP